MLNYAKNVVRLVILDFFELSQDPDVFKVFLDEFRKLFKRTGILKFFSEISGVVFDIFNK